MKPSRLISLAIMITTVASPVLAWPGGGVGPSWGGGPYGQGPYGRGWNGGDRGSDSREGKVSVDRFVAPDAKPVLNQSHIAVRAAPGGTGDEREDATFEAAIVDQLAKAGYDTINPDPKGGLVTEVREGRDVVVPEEARHSPVSGEMEAGVSNYGRSFGMGIAVDMTKPRKALVDTRLEARILDRASGRVLWEGRADIITREGDSHWTDTAIAGRLAGALFEHFSGPRP